MFNKIQTILSVVLVIFISGNTEKSNTSLVKNALEFQEAFSSAQPGTAIASAKGVWINIGLFAVLFFAPCNFA